MKPTGQYPQKVWEMNKKIKNRRKLCSYFGIISFVLSYFIRIGLTEPRIVTRLNTYCVYSSKKGKGFPYSLPSVGPGADPGVHVQAVSPQVTRPISHPPSSCFVDTQRLWFVSTILELYKFVCIYVCMYVGCHYFSPGLQLPSQPQSITASWPVPSYTAWW